jgi:hypothetical protein
MAPSNWPLGNSLKGKFNGEYDRPLLFPIFLRPLVWNLVPVVGIQRVATPSRYYPEGKWRHVHTCSGYQTLSLTPENDSISYFKTLFLVDFNYAESCLALQFEVATGVCCLFTAHLLSMTNRPY